MHLLKALSLNDLPRTKDFVFVTLLISSLATNVWLVRQLQSGSRVSEYGLGRGDMAPEISGTDVNGTSVKVRFGDSNVPWHSG